MGALSVYLDTSVIVPLFLHDSFVARVRAFFATGPVDPIVSDFTSAEFASVMGIKVRNKELTTANARIALSTFDDWTGRRTVRVEMGPGDIRSAETTLRNLTLNLRAPDAIHIAIARRLGADLATLDARMAENAWKLGISVVAV